MSERCVSPAQQKRAKEIIRRYENTKHGPGIGWIIESLVLKGESFNSWFNRAAKQSAGFKKYGYYQWRQKMMDVYGIGGLYATHYVVKNMCKVEDERIANTEIYARFLNPQRKSQQSIEKKEKQKEWMRNYMRDYRAGMRRREMGV